MDVYWRAPGAKLLVIFLMWSLPMNTPELPRANVTIMPLEMKLTEDQNPSPSLRIPPRRKSRKLEKRQSRQLASMTQPLPMDPSPLNDLERAKLRRLFKEANNPL